MKLKKISKNIDIELYSPASYEVIHAQQGDSKTREIHLTLYDQGEAYAVPSGVKIRLEGHRGDGSDFPAKDCSCTGNVIIATLDDDILHAPGIAEAKIILTDTADGSILSSVPFKINVQKNPCDKNKIASEQHTVIDQIKLDIDRLKEDTDAHFKNQSNPHRVTKAQVGLGNADNTADANKYVKSATMLTTARAIDGVNFNGTANINHFGTCATAASTAAKTVSIQNFSLSTGARASVLFNYNNTAASPTLNVSGTGAKSIYYNGTSLTSANAGILRGCCEFVYSGSYWRLTGSHTLVKGNAESSYRKDLVNLTPQNLGTLPVKELTKAQYEALSASQKSNGTIYYIPDEDNSIPNASSASSGLMSSSDKKKLDGIENNANNYSLPPASSSTRGGVKTGYAQNGKNYPVKLSGEKMYVSVPWDDVWVGICGSGKASAAKAVDLNGFQLKEYVRIAIYFTFGNTASNITLNINGTGAKAVLYKNQPVPSDYIKAETGIDLIYYAGNYRIIGSLADTQAEMAYAQANNAYARANNAYARANSAYTQANSAYAKANSAYNTASNLNTSLYGNSSQLSIGFDASATNDYTTAVGYRALALNTSATAFGCYANASGILTTALGYHVYASGYGTTAIGSNTGAGSHFSTAIGHEASASGNNSSAFGAFSYACNSGTTSGSYSRATGNNSSALGHCASASAFSSLALGSSANASGPSSIAIGTNAKTNDVFDLALGGQASATGNQSAALGCYANASAYMSIALGGQASATNTSAIAAGYSAIANGHSSISLGYAASASGSSGTAFGSYSNASGNYSAAFGYYSSAPGSSSIAIGSSHANASGDYSMALIGNASASGYASISIGHASHANTYSISLGHLSRSVSNSIAIGSSTSAGIINSIAIGPFTYADEANSIALGNNTGARGNSSAAIGDCAIAFSSQSVAIGKNASTRGNDSIALGYAASASGSSGTALGHRASAQNESSVALGVNSNAQGNRSLALGCSSSTFGSNSIGIGHAAHSSGNSSVSIGSSSGAGSYGSVALGSYTNASGSYSVAIGGAGACSAGYASIALGGNASASGENAVALGHGSRAHGNNSTALGVGANIPSSASNCIQLGSSSLSSIRAAVPVTVTSDERDKADIEEIKDGAVEFLKKVRAIRYVFNHREWYIDEESMSEEDQENRKKYGLCAYDKKAHEAGGKKGSRIRAGISAQNTMQALKEVYGSSSYANLINDNFFDLDESKIPEGVENQLSANYEGFIPFLIKAVQELDERLHTLERGK